MPLFARQGPSGRFPRVTAPIAALRLPASPLRSLALARQFRLMTERTGSPKFLGNPRHTCPGLRSRRSHEAGLRGIAPTLRFADVAFRAFHRVGLRDYPISRFNSAACVLAIYASWPRL